jgi:urease accessory protein
VARDGCTVLEDLRREAPLGVFPAPGPAPGWARVWLVGSAGGPVGGDDVELAIEVTDGAALAVGSVAASIALAGAAPSRLAVRAVVEPGASLVWAPEPLVATAGADHCVDVELEVSRTGHLWWREELVLGRAGEPPGRCTVRQVADRDGSPWVRHELAVGGTGWDGAAVVGGHRVIGSVLTTAEPCCSVTGAAAHLRPEAGGTLTLALAGDRPALDQLLPLPEFPPLQRSHDAASRVDA